MPVIASWHNAGRLKGGAMYLRNKEPSIDELLNDEVLRLVMARDGLSEAMLRAVIRDAQNRLLAPQRYRVMGFDA